MSRDRYDVLERYAPLVRAPEPDLERFLGIQERRQRNQRLSAGAVALVVFVAAVWIVVGGRLSERFPTPAVTGPSGADADTRVGFVGLPPEGAVPSAPADGELVMSVDATIGGPLYRAWIYADGRMIWYKHADLRYGANHIVTGYLEQRLTPAGVARFRSRVLATGLFDHDLGLSTRGTSLAGTVRVRAGDGFVTVSWVHEDDAFVPPPVDAVPATAEQEDALNDLELLFRHPIPSWIPDEAWANRTIRPYVASRYAFCSTAPSGSLQASGFLSALPGPAASLLRGTTPMRLETTSGDRFCWDVSTDDARILEQLLPHIRAERDPTASAWGGPYYRAEIGRADVEVVISFEPYLPDGTFICAACSPHGGPFPN